MRVFGWLALRWSAQISWKCCFIGFPPKAGKASSSFFCSQAFHHGLAVFCMAGLEDGALRANMFCRESMRTGSRHFHLLKPFCFHRPLLVLKGINFTTASSFLFCQGTQRHMEAYPQTAFICPASSRRTFLREVLRFPADGLDDWALANGKCNAEILAMSCFAQARFCSSLRRSTSGYLPMFAGPTGFPCRTHLVTWDTQGTLYICT